MKAELIPIHNGRMLMVTEAFYQRPKIQIVDSLVEALEVAKVHMSNCEDFIMQQDEKDDGYETTIEDLNDRIDDLMRDNRNKQNKIESLNRHIDEHLREKQRLEEEVNILLDEIKSLKTNPKLRGSE